MRLRLATILLFLSVLFGSAQGLAQQRGNSSTEAPSVELVEIAARKKPETKGGQMFGREGLELKFVARVPGKTLISIDKQATTLTSFKDSAGTDLAAGADKGFFYWVSMQSSFDGPKDTVNLEVRTKTLPNKKASRVNLKATIVLLSATKTANASQKIKVEKGAKLTAGPVPMKVSSAKNDQIEFQATEKLDAIQKIEFLDASGKPIKSQSMGSGSFGFGGKMTYSKSFSLGKAYDEVTVKITYYDKLESLEIPIDVDVGLGL